MLLCVLGTLAFALFMSAQLFVRSDASSISDWVGLPVYLGRVARVLVYFGVAFLLPNLRLNSGRPLLAVLACEILYLFCANFLRLVLPLEAATQPLFDAFVAVLGGIVGALFTLLFLTFLARFTPRWSGVAIPAAIAGSHLAFIGLSALPSDLVLWCKPTLPLVAVLLLAWCLVRDRSTQVLTPRAAVDNPRTSTLSLTFASTVKEFSLVLTGAIIFPFLYVLIAEINIHGGIQPGFYSAPYELIGVAVLLALSICSYVLSNRISLEAAFILVLPIFATAMLLLPLFWGSEIFPCILLIKCGYLLYNALLWSNLARQTHERPSTALLNFGIATGTLDIFSLLGRVTGSVLTSFAWVNAETIAQFSLVAVWLLTMGLLVFFLLAQRRKNALLLAAENASENQRNPEYLAAQCHAYGEMFGLTKREREVLAEFARGRSADYLAKKLVVSKETVKSHLKRIYIKTGVHNRQELLDGIESIKIE